MKKGKAIILLVANRSEQINLLSDALISIGHTVTIVTSGNAAISAAGNRRYDLVIADIGLSDLSKTDFHRSMKERYPDLPLILITGPSKPTIVETAAARGLISKPFRISHIEDLIGSLLKESRHAVEQETADIVLVVDDDDAFRTMLIRSLQLSGYEALGAADGKMAIERLESGGIGTVITDINMPYMDGVTLMKKIKERWPQIPVVLITGYYSDDENPAGSDNRPDGFLMKPFRIQSIDKILKGFSPAKSK